MTFITREILQKFTSNILEKTCALEIEALSVRKAKLADEIFFTHIATKEQYELMKSLPKGFFKGDHALDISFYLNDRVIRDAYLKMSEFRLMPENARWTTIAVRDADMCNEYLKIQAEERKIYSDRDNIVNNANSIAQEAKTTEELLRIWPEAKEFLPDPEAEKAKAQAEIITNLNAALKINVAQF